MSCIVLQFENAVTNFIKELGVSFNGKVQDTHFVLHDSTISQNSHFGVQKTCTECCETVAFCETVNFPTFFLEI